MKRERIVEFVGGSEESVAYLRLMLRKSASGLTDRWRVRHEDDGSADVLIIGDLTGAGGTIPGSPESAQRRVRLFSPAFGIAGIESALWPLGQERLTQLLNHQSAQVEPAKITPGPVIQHNIYDELFEPDAADSRHDHDHTVSQADTSDFLLDCSPPPRAPESADSLQAEQLFRNDPRARQKDLLQSLRLHDDIGVEATDGRTAGSSLRKDKRTGSGELSGVAHTLTVAEANVRHPLASYLTGNLLPSPSRLDAADVVLTLDPRNQQYYAKGALCVFEDLCKLSLRRVDWKQLALTDFNDVKKQNSPRPYAELVWLSAYVDDSGAGSDQPAADVRFRLRQNFGLQRDYPRAARVAKELENGSTLTHAASVARVTTAEARRVARAFDAIGYLVPD
jgi:hypothetical protein